MKPNIVITAGSYYLDIDAYSSCIAYRELLRSLGTNAFAVSTAQPNESIPQLIKALPFSFDNYTPKPEDNFIVLDLSDPEFIDTFVNHENIVELIDHHTGFEKYWKRRLGPKARIEKIGSVATIIYEKFAESKRTDLLSSDLCKLLLAAIIDNTLNMKSTVTTDRDRLAYEKLIHLGELDLNWGQIYLEHCENAILSDLENAIRRDTKTLHLGNLPEQVGQVTILNHEKVLEQQKLIHRIFKESPDWVLNLISLKDGKSYLITNSDVSKDKLTKLFSGKFKDNVLILDSFLLRKEILAKADSLAQ